MILLSNSQQNSNTLNIKYQKTQAYENLKKIKKLKNIFDLTTHYKQ